MNFSKWASSFFLFILCGKEGGGMYVFLSSSLLSAAYILGDCFAQLLLSSIILFFFIFYFAVYQQSLVSAVTVFFNLTSHVGYLFPTSQFYCLTLLLPSLFDVSISTSSFLRDIFRNSVANLPN